MTHAEYQNFFLQLSPHGEEISYDHQEANEDIAIKFSDYSILFSDFYGHWIFFAGILLFVILRTKSVTLMQNHIAEWSNAPQEE